MVARKQLLTIMAEEMDRNLHTLELISSELTKAGLLQAKGHGLYALPVTPQACLRLFLGVVGSEKYSGAVMAVKRLSQCQESSKGMTLAQYLDEIFFFEGLAEKVQEIWVCRTFPEVEISFKEAPAETTIEGEFPAEPAFTVTFHLPEGYHDEFGEIRRPGLNTWAVVDGKVIYKMALAVESGDWSRPGITG